MYVNQDGQMCGPYIQEQLHEGLSTGFLPDDLPVYPIFNGTLTNPVPLKYFRQFPDHVATGFAYLNAEIPSANTAASCSKGCGPLYSDPQPRYSSSSSGNGYSCKQPTSSLDAADSNKSNWLPVFCCFDL